MLDILAHWPKRRHIFLYAGATVATIALTFFMLVTSEPYHFSNEFVASDPRILKITGLQRSKNIAPLKGFRSTFGDRTGEAHFTFKVNGDSGDFYVRIEVRKREGLWTVIKVETTSSDGVTNEVIGAGF